MAKTVEVEVFVLVDNCGDYSAASTIERAKEAYESDVQQLSDSEGFRVVRVKLTVPLPEIPELTGVVPAEGQAALVSVA